MNETYQVTRRDKLVIEALVWFFTLLRLGYDGYRGCAAVVVWVRRAPLAAVHRARSGVAHLRAVRHRVSRLGAADLARPAVVDVGSSSVAVASASTPVDVVTNGLTYDQQIRRG